MGQVEHPSSLCILSSAVFFVGRDRQGRWVAQAHSGLCGGLFVSSDQAIRFALSENGNKRNDVVMVAGILELDVTGSIRPTPSASQLGAPSRRQNPAASASLSHIHSHAA